MVQGRFCDVCKTIQKKNKSGVKNLRIYEQNRSIVLSADICSKCQDKMFKFMKRTSVNDIIVGVM